MQDHNGITALMHLAQADFLGIIGLSGLPLDKIKALLVVGADRNLTNNAGKTAKDLATHPQVIALL